MVTTVNTKTVGGTATAKAKSISLGGAGKLSGGNGGRSPQPPNGGGGDQPWRARQDGAPQQYRIGMWLALAAILMMFAALSSAYVFRSTRALQNWQAFEVPRLLWVSTGLILLSSATFEVARRALKKERADVYRLWLGVSLLLGLGFLISQLSAWRQLVGQGIYLATNPHSSFFYLLTGLHAIHLLGGILGLSFLLLRARRITREGQSRQAQAKRGAIADAMGLYWHFMDGLWVYLFALLFLWR